MAQIISSPFTPVPHTHIPTHTHSHPAPQNQPITQSSLISITGLRFNPTTPTTLDLRQPNHQSQPNYSYPSQTQYKAYIIRRKLPQIGGRRSWTQVDIVEDPVSPYESLTSRTSPHHKPSKHAPWRGRSAAEVYDSLRLDLQRSAVDYILQGLNGMKGGASGLRWCLADLQVEFREVRMGGWRRGMETRQIRVVVKSVEREERGLLHHWSLPGEFGAGMRWEQQQRQSMVVDTGDAGQVQNYGSGHGHGHEHHTSFGALLPPAATPPAIMAPIEHIFQPLTSSITPYTHRTNKVDNNFDKGYGGPTTIHNYHPGGQQVGDHGPSATGPTTRLGSQPIISPTTPGGLDEEVLNLDGARPGNQEGYGKQAKGKGKGKADETRTAGLKQATGLDHQHDHNHAHHHHAHHHHGHGHDHGIKHIHHEHHPPHHHGETTHCPGHNIPASLRKYFESLSLGEHQQHSTHPRHGHHHNHQASHRLRRGKHPFFEHDDMFDEVDGRNGWETSRERRRSSVWSNGADNGRGFDDGHRRRNDGTGRRSYLGGEMW